MRKKPEGYTPVHTSYLNALRISGITNMLAAAPYLVEEFGLPLHTATDYLVYWMEVAHNDNARS